MQNSSLIKILKVLTEQEIKQLKNYLNCNYLNKNKQAAKLFGILCLYHPEFDSPKLQAAKIYSRIYAKNAEYLGNESNFRTLMAELKKAIDYFLILKELKENNAQQQLLLLDAYIKRSVQDNLIERLTQKYLKHETVISSWYFYHRFQLYWKLYNHQMEDGYDPNSQSFALLNEHFDNFFSLTKLKLGIERNNLTKRNIPTPPIKLLSALQTFLQENIANIPPTIQLYAKLFELSHNPEKGVSRYKKILSLFETQIHILGREDNSDIAAILFNFANKKIKFEIFPAIYKRLRYEILRLGVQHQLYITDQVMQSTEYNNIVLSAAAVAEFAWADNFMKQHEKHLTPAAKFLCLKESKGVYHYYRARHFQSSDDYLQCIQSFAAPQQRNQIYNSKKIWYSLIAHYENFVLSKAAGIFDYTHNFHKLVNKNQGFSAQQKRQLLNTNNALKFMANVRNGSKASLTSIHKKLAYHRTKDFFRVKWMNEMFSEFEQFIRENK